MKQTIAHLNKDGKNYPIHLSFDIDGCDPRDAPGTGTLCRGGLNWREA
jgi:arginase